MALPTAPSLSESVDAAALLRRLRDGDDAAFDTVFRTWYAPLVRYATRIVGDGARAEEVVQDVMLALWERRASLSAQAVLQHWLFAATRNRALNLVRHDGIVARRAPSVHSTLRGAEDDMPLAERAVREAEVWDAVDAAVSALPPRCREVFLLSRRQGLPQAEIALRLGISVKAVEAHIRRALRELRVALEQWLPRDAR